MNLASLVTCRPIACEFLHCLELHALGSACDRLAVRPARRRDPLVEIDELLLGNADVEGAGALAALAATRCVETRVMAPAAEGRGSRGVRVMRNSRP